MDSSVGPGPPARPSDVGGLSSSDRAQREPTLPPPPTAPHGSGDPSPAPIAPFDKLDREFPPDAVVTYRHLLSPQSLTPGNPLRVIGHCDVDAAYAQFEGVRLGLDKTVPVAVQQWQGLIAINYPARAFGITRHMNITEARKKCPHIIACHVATLKDGEDEPKYHDDPQITTHKVSLEPYRKESVKIIKVFQRCVPDGEIEKASIDEAYIDLSLPVRNLLLSRYPHLATLPDDATLDTPLPPAPDLDWAASEWGIPPSPIPVDGDSSSVGGGWADVALWIGGEMMEHVRGEVETELGYTTSAGIAHNKILAKVCSAYKKPRAQTVLRTSAVSRFLRPMAFQKIRLLGGKLGEAIAAEYGVEIVGDMLTVTLEEMQRRFGEESLWIFNVLRGVDHAEVKQKSLAKSMLASKNMRPALRSLADGAAWLRVLCVELVGRLKEAREADDVAGDGEGGVWPKTLVLSWREADIHHNNAGSSNKSRQLPFPFHRPLVPDGLILKIATRLLGEVLAPNAKARPGGRVIKIINLALGFSGLERREEGQRGIEAFLRGSGTMGAPKRKAEKETEVVVLDDEEEDDDIADLETTTTTTTNAVAGPSSPRKVAPTTLPPPPDSAQPPPLKKARATSSTATTPDEASSFWTCPECNKSLPVPTFSSVDRVRDEHQDWHIAKALQDETVGGGGGGSSSSGSGSGTKREGIGKPKAKAKPQKKKAAGGGAGGGLGGWLLRK